MKFFELYPNRDTWTVQAVKTFCDAKRKRLIVPLDQILNFYYARRQRDEDPYDYLERLKGLTVNFSKDMLTAIILYKAITEHPSKEIFCNIDDLNHNAVAEVWQRKITTDRLVARISGNKHLQTNDNAQSKNTKNIVTLNTNKTDKQQTLAKNNKFVKKEPEVKVSEKTNWQTEPRLKSQFLKIPPSLLTPPMAYEAIRIHGHDLRVLLDSGANCNILSLHDVKTLGLSFVEENISVEGVNSVQSNFIGYLDAQVSILGNSKSVFSKFYIAENHESSIHSELCLSLGISTDDIIKELIVERDKILNSLKSLHNDQPQVAQLLIQNPHIFDNSAVTPKVLVNIPLKCKPERKLCRSYRPKGNKFNFLANTLRKDIVEDKIEQVFSLYLSCPSHVVGDKKLRLVVDPKQVNECMEDIYIELFSMQELQEVLSGATRFYRFDFSAAFKTLGLRDEDKYLFTFSTCFGNYQSKRLNFGYSCASQIFQMSMEDLFYKYDIKNYLIYIDDTLLSGHDEELEHNVEKFINMIAECNF